MIVGCIILLIKSVKIYVSTIGFCPPVYKLEGFCFVQHGVTDPESFKVNVNLVGLSVLGQRLRNCLFSPKVAVEAICNPPQPGDESYETFIEVW